MEGKLKNGDIIKCHDADEMIELMTELARQNVETDFMYEHNGVKGHYLIVTKVSRRFS